MGTTICSILNLCHSKMASCPFFAFLTATNVVDFHLQIRFEIGLYKCLVLQCPCTNVRFERAEKELNWIQIRGIRRLHLYQYTSFSVNFFNPERDIVERGIIHEHDREGFRKSA